MQGKLNPKIVGATIVGFALVAGAFTVSSMLRPAAVPQPEVATTAAASPRVAIDVSDNNHNGIEDWRDEFIVTKPVVLDQASSTYTPPNTLTGETGINLTQDLMLAKTYGPFGHSQEEIIKNTVDTLAQETDITIYDTPDIDIMEEWDDQDILNYANTAAAVIYNNSVPDLDGELEILYDILSTQDKSRLPELDELAEVYQGYRDDTLKIPVPRFLAKEHLDLINSYHAIYEDIKAMTLTFNDPAVTLLRLKRYQDDATGLAYSLQNMYLALEPYSDLFTDPNEPAALFSLFSPDLKIN